MLSLLSSTDPAVRIKLPGIWKYLGVGMNKVCRSAAGSLWSLSMPLCTLIKVREHLPQQELPSPCIVERDQAPREDVELEYRMRAGSLHLQQPAEKMPMSASFN